MFDDITINFDINNNEIHVIIKLKNSIIKQKTNEIFTLFLIKLNFIFNLKSFFEIQKCMYFRDFIIFRLKNVIIVIYNLNNYRIYTKQITQIVNNLTQNELKYKNNRQINKIKSTYFRKIRDNNVFLFIRTFRKNNKKKLNAVEKNIIQLDSHTKRFCIKKNVCSKCFIKKHLIIDKNALCKNEFFVNVIETKIKLVVLNIF